MSRKFNKEASRKLNKEASRKLNKNNFKFYSTRYRYTLLNITHLILSFTCKWINQSKGMITKQYNSISQRNQKQNIT